VVPDKGIQIPKGQAPMYEKQRAEGPQENPKEMPLDYVVPDVNVQVMFFSSMPISRARRRVATGVGGLSNNLYAG